MFPSNNPCVSSMPLKKLPVFAAIFTCTLAANSLAAQAADLYGASTDISASYSTGSQEPSSIENFTGVIGSFSSSASTNYGPYEDGNGNFVSGSVSYLYSGYSSFGALGGSANTTATWNHSGPDPQTGFNGAVDPRASVINYSQWFDTITITSGFLAAGTQVQVEFKSSLESLVGITSVGNSGGNNQVFAFADFGILPGTLGIGAVGSNNLGGFTHLINIGGATG